MGTRETAGRIGRSVAVLVVVLVLAGCASVAPYDRGTDDALLTLARDAHEAMSRVAMTPAGALPPPSATHAHADGWTFRQVRTSLAVLRIAVESRPNHERPLAQVEALEAEWKLFEDRVKAGAVSPAYATTARDIFLRSIRDARRLEIYRRRLP